MRFSYRRHIQFKFHEMFRYKKNSHISTIMQHILKLQGHARTAIKAYLDSLEPPSIQVNAPHAPLYFSWRQ